MAELKGRISLIYETLEPEHTEHKRVVSSVEMAALQLRKCYELIGLSSISVNKDLYIKQWKNFEKDWKLSKILNNIESLNSDFLPSSKNGISGWKSKPDLSKEQLLRYHGNVSDLLHANNPYTKQLDYPYWKKWITKRSDEIRFWLSKHKVTFAGGLGVFGCYLSVDPDDRILVFGIEAKQ
jgi:hypothetical protein